MTEETAEQNLKGLKKIAYTYLDNTVAVQDNRQQAAYLLSEQEQTQIRQIKLRTVIMAAIIGAVAVLAYYLPVYYAEGKWGSSEFTLFGKAWKWVDLAAMIYGILLVWPEIWLLNVLNMRAIKNMCIACNYPNRETENVKHVLDKLTDVGLELEVKELQQFGVNPYLGMSKAYFWMFTLFFKFKATLSNLLVKLVLKRLLGRYALRAITDLAGMPVFGFWNAWASHTVIEEAKMRIMLPEAIQMYLQTQFSDKNVIEIEKNGKLLVQFVAQLKRKYNYAMYLYALELEQFYGVKLQRENEKREVKLEDLVSWSNNDLTGFSKLLALGFAVDGELSRKEKREIEILRAKGAFDFTVAQVQTMATNFKNGRGFVSNHLQQ